MFEWDPTKSNKTKAERGLSFDQAKALWKDPEAVYLPARSEDEPRTLIIGSIDGKVWTAVFTERGNKIRIISVRRSRTKERKLYEG